MSQIVPILEATVFRTVRPVGAEDAAELLQDVTATAAKFVDSCERRGKKIIPNSIAYYAIQQARGGRRSYAATRTDVMSPGAQLDESVSLDSMDDVVLNEFGDELTLHEMLASESEDPSQAALREIDWAELLEDFNERDIAVLQATVNGDRVDELAASFGISSARICQLKRELGEQVRLRWGDNVLNNVLRQPGWNANIRAQRERLGCRHERMRENRSAS